MTTEFSDVRQLAEKSFGAAFVPSGGSAFSLSLEPLSVSFSGIPEDPALAIVRTRVLDMDGVARKGGLALAALEGNFFWSGMKVKTPS